MLEKLLDGSFMPHGHCLLWRDDLLFLHLTGDVLTFVAYFLIPIALIYLVKKRDDLAFNWLFMLFAAFILLCGITHTISVLNIWYGFYYLAGFAKLATGIVSILTAFILWKLIPAILHIPSKAMLEASNNELFQIKYQLEETNRDLERRVTERTKELAELATSDSLTGLLNHAEILKQAELEFE